MRKPGRPHLLRWYNQVESLPILKKLLESFTKARSDADKARKNKRTEHIEAELPNAVPGKVVVRFAPEPSGYLHIGHLKAAILNRFFADKYNGKYILRFDDTNPTKEEGEFEDAIKEDLAMIEVSFDKVVHTSDHFDKIREYTEKLIQQGDAFMDDTDAELVKEQRRALVPSKNRDASIEDNLKRFHEMCEGTPEGQKWSLRAKIDYTHKNGTMRDPVIYRYVGGSHHITGDKYKAYPMYDLACPLIDHIDGVTHALRANEYAARHEQYAWFLQKLGLPNIEIFDFSRIDFVYTVLSKRKLKYLVDQGVVSGWGDPRFPTVRGIRSRGMTVKGLKDYIVGQGASQQMLQLEWDGIWNVNKRVIDPIAPRYWAIAEEKMVPVEVIGGPAKEEVVKKPLHKKDPKIGEKDLVLSSHLIMEQADAKSFGDNEEITAMDWGNVIVTEKKVDAAGDVESLKVKLHLEGDFKKTSKKVTWLSAPTKEHPLTPVVLIEYDYLITKKKLEEDDNLTDVINPKTEYRVNALASAEVAQLKKWDIIQFERKGFYIYQGEKDAEGRMQFGYIPDGRAESIALKAKPAAVSAAPKDKSAPKGSWGKPGAKKAAPAPAAAAAADGTKTVLSDATEGFEIPIKTKMFESDRIYGNDGVHPEPKVNMFKSTPVYEQ
ncbi:glutamate-tRNA ligase [Trichosporon asahii var. asahii CBS 2479]|uniref:glutamate--tRNA ligase n=1 Tax=Trichosporon asahii var. asahii (strain ATCC 90039 / CBS 2479 / JCM 2466 / KCTC 7840 / NBRC 103889/ NCYC 2677 / UAMH 7654) TaxID=1186058 RepID=J6EZZ0_TRIAS|nr:glutamate-tRNA ligase [Trichosporon asahii var. asahii CBS 2479]EJT50244.1 glutamate-tRNA ligase [Trichosporon asahii var. asahii CBS 2479]